jgi:hypothetical protein
MFSTMNQNLWKSFPFQIKRLTTLAALRNDADESLDKSCVVIVLALQRVSPGEMAQIKYIIMITHLRLLCGEHDGVQQLLVDTCEEKSR